MSTTATHGIKFKDKVGYALGDTAGLLTFSLIGAFQNKFYTGVLGIDPGKIVLLILIARIWDAVNDPLWGAFIQSRKPSPKGQFRPWILGFSVPLAVSAVLMFFKIPGLTATQYLVFAYITYILYGMMYTAVNIPYGSLASVVTDDELERSSLSMWRSIGAGVGGLPGTIVLPMIVFTVTGYYENGTPIKALDGQKLFWCVLILSVVSIGVYYLHYRMTKERIAPQARPKDTEHTAAPRRIDWVSNQKGQYNIIQINKRNIATSIILSIVTFGVYFIYWEYLLVKNTRAIKKDESSCTGEMLCLIFIPFYSLYWWFTRGKTVKDEFTSLGYSATGNEIAYLVLGIFGFSIVSMAIMQNDFNSLPSETVDTSTQSNQRSAHTAAATVRELLHNRAFIMLSLASMLLIAFQFYYQSTYLYLFTDYYHKPGLYSFVTICTYVPMAIFIPIMNRLIKKFGKKELCACGMAFAAVVNIILFALRGTPLAHNPTVFLVFTFFSGLGQTFLVLEVWALVMDVIDYHEVRTGKREEGMAYAVFSFTRKLGQTLAGVGLNALLALIPYNDTLSQKGEVLSDAVLSKLYDISTLVPAIMLTLMAVLLFFGYDLSKKKLVTVRADLDALRRAESE